MQGITPCPKCGGEVEMVKLNKKKKSDPDMFRIECRKCHMLVVRGQGFPCETLSDAKKRIEEYNAYMANVFPTGRTSGRIVQSAKARNRDNMSRYAHRAGE